MSYVDPADIHSDQLEEIRIWLNEFKKKNFNHRSEVIVFDIVVGDFNIDNMSPGICNGKYKAN